MCMVTMRTEPNCHLFGFSHRFRPLNISARDTLESAMRTAYNGTFGGTDCSLPMIYARKKRIPVDVFVIYTDNETHSGYSTGHPSQALQRYRQAMGIGAKLIVVAMTSTGYSIADPQDPGMLDVVGFDTNTPRAISEFARS